MLRTSCENTEGSTQPAEGETAASSPVFTALGALRGSRMAALMRPEQRHGTEGRRPRRPSFPKPRIASQGTNTTLRRAPPYKRWVARRLQVSRQAQTLCTLEIYPGTPPACMPFLFTPTNIILTMAVCASLLIFLHLVYLAFLYGRPLRAQRHISDISNPSSPPHGSEHLS